MQAVAVGAGSPCLVPTASQSCRHPGAISEIADLTHSLSVSRSLTLYALSRLTFQWDSLRSGLKRFVCCLWQSLIRITVIILMQPFPCRQGQKSYPLCLPYPATIPSVWLYSNACIHLHDFKSLTQHFSKLLLLVKIFILTTIQCKRNK